MQVLYKFHHLNALILSGSMVILVYDFLASVLLDSQCFPKIQSVLQSYLMIFSKQVVLFALLHFCEYGFVPIEFFQKLFSVFLVGCRIQ